MTLACLLKEVRDEQLRGKGDIQARTCRIGEQDWDSRRWETHYLLRRQWQVKYSPKHFHNTFQRFGGERSPPGLCSQEAQRYKENQGWKGFRRGEGARSKK